MRVMGGGGGLKETGNVARLYSKYQQHELHTTEQTDRLSEQQVDSGGDAAPVKHLKHLFRRGETSRHCIQSCWSRLINGFLI